MVLKRDLTMDRNRPLQRLMTSVQTVGRTSTACFALPRIHIRPNQNSTTAVVILLTAAMWSCLSKTVQSDGCCTGCSTETCCSQGFYWNGSESSSTTASNTLSTSNRATSGQLTENSVTSTPAISMLTSGPADSCCGGYCLPCNKTVLKCNTCSYSKATNTAICKLCDQPLIVNEEENKCVFVGASDTYKFVIVGVVCGVLVVALLLTLVIFGFRKGWWESMSCEWPFGGVGGGGVNHKPSVPRPEDCDWPPPPSVNVRKNTVRSPMRYTRTPSSQDQRRNDRQPGNGRQAIPSVVYDDPASQDLHELSTVEPVTSTSKTTTTTGQGKGLSRPGNTSVKIQQRHEIVSMEPLDADQELYQNFAPTGHVTPADQSTTSHARVENGGRRNVHHLMTSSSTDVNDELYMNGPEPPATMTSPTPVPVRIVNGNVGSGSSPNASDNDESEYGNQFEIQLALRQMQQQQQQPAEDDGDQEVYANAETFSQNKPPPVAPRPTAHRH